MATSDTNEARVQENTTEDTPVTRIEPTSGWRAVDFRELWEYRDLFYFLLLRDIKGRYAQSVLGVGWAVIQPLFYMIVFTFVFSRLLGVQSDGSPYVVFSYVALVPWTYFSQAVTASTSSLIANRGMLTKVYFPRLVIPMSAVLAKLVDFVFAALIVIILMAWYGITPTTWVLIMPLLVLLMVASAAGIGMWLTALAIQYRDVNFGIGFGIQLLMYLSPVVYPASAIPEKFEKIYALNPMVGVIEGFRASLLGASPMPWDLIAISAGTATILVLSGIYYFRRMERIYADVA
jgi:lipopolysaccharide transport system permease protein